MSGDGTPTSPRARSLPRLAVVVPCFDEEATVSWAAPILREALTALEADGSIAQAARALDITLQYAKERSDFGAPIGTFQHNRFALAEMRTEVDLGRAYVDRCLEAHVDGELSAVEAAEAKWWTTEMCQRVLDRGLQLHGGYGYMVEYPIARAWVDSRIQTIYAGTTEVMKEIIGRSLGL